MTPEQLHAAALHRLEAECYLAHLGDCDGRLYAAHYPIPKRTLRLPNVVRTAGVSADVLVADPANGILLCGRHHHLVDYGGLVIEREDLPIRFAEFERRYDLRHVTDRLYDRRRAYAARRNDRRSDTTGTSAGHGNPRNG